MKNLILSIFILLITTNCSGLKKTFGSSSYNKSYQEKIIAFWSKPNESGLILIAEKYNYKFNPSKGLNFLFQNQKVLNLNSFNMKLNIRVKEYKSSAVTLSIFSHFEKSKLNERQIKWLEINHYSLEKRAREGGKKSEPRPAVVEMYLKSWTLYGEREESKIINSSEKLISKISLEVSEHIKR